MISTQSFMHKIQQGSTMSNNREEAELREEQRTEPQLECRPQDLENFFHGLVWKDMLKVFEGEFEKCVNDLADMDLDDPLKIAQTRARLAQIKWLQNELSGYMIGVAEGLTPE